MLWKIPLNINKKCICQFMVYFKTHIFDIIIYKRLQISGYYKNVFQFYLQDKNSLRPVINCFPMNYKTKTTVCKDVGFYYVGTGAPVHRALVPISTGNQTPIFTSLVCHADNERKLEPAPISDAGIRSSGFLPNIPQCQLLAAYFLMSWIRYHSLVFTCSILWRS